MTSARFEELRNENGVLYKLRGKLSKNKMADIVIVPKTKMAFMHLNDYSNAWDDGSFDKNSSRFVSLSMTEAGVLRNLMYTMDDQVQALINAAPPTGKKRKSDNNQQIPVYHTGIGQQHQPQLSSTGGYHQLATAATTPAIRQQQQQQPQLAATSQNYQAPIIQPQQQASATTQSYQLPGEQQPQPVYGGYQSSYAAVQPFNSGTYQTAASENNQDYINQLFATYQ